MEVFVWIGIAFCLSQSAMFSGLNLAFFSLTRLRLEIEASQNKSAEKVLAMREDSNFLLTTILWGNVGINVLLTLLSDSVLAGVDPRDRLPQMHRHPSLFIPLRRPEVKLIESDLVSQELLQTRPRVVVIRLP